MSIRLHPHRAADPAGSGADHDVLVKAVASSDRRAVLATGDTDGAAASLPGVEVVVVRAVSGDDGAMRLVRRLARADHPPRIVVVGDPLAGPTEALAAGADAWIDQRAELDTVLVAMHGRPRPSPTPRRRRWWRR
ncbi:MAG TPA: hypothetical protein VK906_09475 [Egicoccus sp.]|nr:hypothetical protein [Egicoccus sp.]HSK23394.1 hypothetical protein [Egicoccus sp.]